jgi:GMP synthase (glutamine-hydrolysing)
VRDDLDAQEQERLCFLESCGLAPEELATINLLEEPNLQWRHLSRADAILIGGAGAHSATVSYPFSSALKAIVERVVDEGKPMFASCFGHHFLVLALGGELITDHHRGEVGTFDVQLTDNGLRDQLLESYPSQFPVQLGHHDIVLDIPPGVRELAYSVKCRYQMLRFADKPIYSTQFHGEMSESHLRARLEMYRDSYLSAETSEEELSLPLRPSLWADKLLRRFFELYV